MVLAGGARWPTSALSVLARLPDKLSLETLTELQKLDRQLKRVDGEPARKLRVGNHRGAGEQPRSVGDGLSA